MVDKLSSFDGECFVVESERADAGLGLVDDAIVLQGRFE